MHVEDDPTVPLGELLRPGDMVDHFKVMRLLGRGGMGEVYLARDTRLGRKVALKIIRPAQLGSREALGRFVLEAQTTARFNHPHIVTIYAVGDHQGVPYVALEYLEGETLRRRLRAQRLSLMEVLRIGLAIAEALTEAHGNHVLHRDLKPENVLLPRDGRLRVVDFGLAKVTAVAEASQIDARAAATSPRMAEIPAGPTDTIPAAPGTSPQTGLASRTEIIVDSVAGRISGTPPYMAPEQWVGGACTEAADVWSLGVMLFEMVTGRLPFQGTNLAELCAKIIAEAPAPSVDQFQDAPLEVVDLVAGALRKDPAARPTAAQLAEALRDVVYRDRARPPAEEDSPFRGLLPFDERHAAFFFGREAEVAAFLERVRQDPLLPVVGPSGAGKSSFVQAGVLPRLREQGLWLVLALRPGAQPFRALASRLLFADSMERRRALDDIETVRVAGDAAPPPREGRPPSSEIVPRDWDSGVGALPQRLFETPQLLAMMLRKLAADSGTRVLLFVDQLEELYTLVEDERVRRRFMQALCSAADDPQDPVRVIFTLRDDFLGKLAEGGEVRDALSRVTVIGSPGPDALEQILLRPLEAVEYRYDDDDLVQEMVAAVHNEPACLPLLQFTTQLLWEHRDLAGRRLRRAIYDQMGGVAGALARHADGVLQGMSPTEVRLAREILLRLVTAAGTRRVLSRAQVLDGLREEAGDVLGRLTQARLVSARKSRGADDAETELELVHESLISAWGRLARWREESHEERSFLEEIDQVAELWARRGHRDDEVWTGEALAEARRLADRRVALPEHIARFLAAGKRRQRRQLLRNRLLLASAFVLLAVAALGSYLGKQRAETQRREARHRWAEAQREGARAALSQGDVLEARAKLRGSLETEDSPLGRALWWRLGRRPLRWRRSMGAVVYSAAFSPDGRTVAVSSQDMSVYLFDTTTAAVRRVLRQHEDQVLSLAFSPDGRRLASGSWAGHVRIFDQQSGALLREISAGKGNILSLAFSPDGERLAFATVDNRVHVWDLSPSGGVRLAAGHTKPVTSVAFSPDGELLASGAKDSTVRVFDARTLAERRLLSGHAETICSVAFGGRPLVLASAGADRTIRLWDLASSGSPPRVLAGHADRVYSVSISPDGRSLASAGSDRTVRVWDRASGSERRVLRGHTGAVYSVRFSPDSKLLVSASSDRSLRVWDLAAAQREPAAGHTSGVGGVAFTPDGSLIASGGLDRTVRLWETATGRQQRVLRGHTDRIYSVAISPDGKLLASGSEDKTVRLWDLGSGREPRVLAGHASGVHSVRFSRDGERLMTAAFDMTVRVWDLARAEPRVFRGHSAGPYSLALSPDGALLASGGFDQSIRIWDLRSAESLPAVVLRVPAGVVTGLDFSPDGERLVSGGHDGLLRLWTVVGGSGRPGDTTGGWTARVAGRQGGRIYGVAFSPDGQHVLTSGSDGVARVWDLEHGGAVELRGHRAEVNQVAFSPDGRRAATTSDDGTVRLWESATGFPYWRAPLLLAGPPQIASHRGWIDLATEKRTEPRAARWRLAVEQRARIASALEERKLICLIAAADTVEAWDTGEDRLLFARRVAGLQEVVAVPAGCATRTDGQIVLHDRAGAVRELVKGASTASWDQGRLLVAAGRSVLAFDGEGRLSESWTVAPGATALARAGDWLVLGFGNGNIEAISTRGDGRRVAPVIEDVPASAVVRILPGPMQTLIVGYANGLLGIWKEGVRLGQAHLHGPVVHLALEGRRLFAATDLGDHRVLDLDAFYVDRCELLRQVWQRVPVVWEAGMAQLRPPPRGHECLRP